VKAGILSDSHDNRGSAADILYVFMREGVGTILHLGDVCSPTVLEPYRVCGLPLLGVFGNNDVDRQGLQAVSGNGFHPGPFALEIAGRKVLMSHAFDELQGEIEERGKFDLVLFGHTHRPLTMHVGRATVLNPGEACGFVTGRPTCAVIDLETMAVRILEVGADHGKGDLQAPGATGRRG
jgi:putative phosphoesterase